jgi:beta-lactam-binding protein with PASTA domain
MALEGVDVVGTGGSSPPVRDWCRVPVVFGLKVPQAAARLAARGCRLGRVTVDPYGVGPSGRVIGFSRIPGWLAPIGGRVNVWISP